MYWLVVLLIAFGVGGIVFLLVREAFRASRNRRETPTVASPVQRSSDASAINALMKQKLPVSSSPQPVTLFTENCTKETDDIADTLDKVPEKPILLDESRAYLCLEEEDDTLERLLVRRSPGRGKEQSAPKEFSIGVTEKKISQLGQENE